MGTVFSGLSPLVIEDVAGEGERIAVPAAAVRPVRDTAEMGVVRSDLPALHGQFKPII
ncbi:hypothetical protein ACIRPX_28875 [Streptomyces sp. NPDC101225]|uniref:hypothetical protein n=1 Tax=Streptomyces sp. NPDC101225 TaxID=3366135 RepID=UPI0037FE33C3